MVSLKRTLQCNLASSIEVLNQLNLESDRSNLHTPLRYSAVLLSIGKTTQICHQNIPLKKVNCNGTVTYISAIPRKLENSWHWPASDIATMLLSILEEQTTQPVWSDIRKNDDWLEFIISQKGMEQWQQQLQQWALSPIPKESPGSIEPEQLWQLQSGYELCCRWQRYHPIDRSSQAAAAGLPTSAFLMSVEPLQSLIHGLLEICDGWDQTTSSQLLQQTKQLVFALQKCIGMTQLSSESKIVTNWLGSTRTVLQQVLQGRLGYPIVEQF